MNYDGEYHYRSGRMSKEDLDIPNEELLEKLDLVVDGKLKCAVCFYRYPEKVIGGCYVKIGKFEGSELLYQDEVHGSLLIMADRVIDLIYLKFILQCLIIRILPECSIVPDILRAGDVGFKKFAMPAKI